MYVCTRGATLHKLKSGFQRGAELAFPYRDALRMLSRTDVVYIEAYRGSLQKVSRTTVRRLMIKGRY